MFRLHIRLGHHGTVLAEGHLDIPDGVDVADLTSRVQAIMRYSGSSYINGTNIFAEVVDVTPPPAATIGEVSGKAVRASRRKAAAPAGTKADGTPRKRNTAKSAADGRHQATPPSREDARKGGKKAGKIQKRRAEADKQGKLL